MPSTRPRSSTWFPLAVQALARLIRSDAPCPSSVMAPDLRSHAVFLRRVLAQLARAGLIEAREGRAGGYLLARAPEAITLAEVYQAVQPLDSAENCAHDCVDGADGADGADTPTLVQSALDEIEAAAERQRMEYLSHVTLANLVERAHEMRQVAGD